MQCYVLRVRIVCLGEYGGFAAGSVYGIERDVHGRGCGAHRDAFHSGRESERAEVEVYSSCHAAKVKSHRCPAKDIGGKSRLSEERGDTAGGSAFGCGELLERGEMRL